MADLDGDGRLDVVIADGDLDICSKVWQPIESNANGGRNHFDFFENLAK